MRISAVRCAVAFAAVITAAGSAQAQKQTVKLAFIGPEKYAYAVWPPTDKYVNIHPHCLHLWARLDLTDGRVLPEFSEILPEVGRSI